MIISKIYTFSDGVTLFFVISGFLITFLLINELEKSSTVNIPKFYMRRILRIWPIYYGYILVAIASLWLIGRQVDLVNNTLWYYILFAANIPFCSIGALWPIVHYWSIGVEEQFYLFWPWLVRIGKKRLLPIAVTVFVVWLACKWGSYGLFGKSFIYRFFSVTRFHCMMIGAIGAILYYQRNKIFMSVLTNKVVTTMAWILFLLSGFYTDFIPAPMRAEYIAIVSLILIMSQVTGKTFIFNLEHKIFDFVGKISYGIYVINPLLLFWLSRWYSSLHITWEPIYQYIVIYVGVIIITIFVAWLSYTFYERPFLHIKNRLAVVKSRNSINS